MTVVSSRRAWSLRRVPQAVGAAVAVLLANACSDTPSTAPRADVDPQAYAVPQASSSLGATGIATGAMTNGGDDFGSITAAGQTDTWTFSGTANQPVAISMAELSGSATFTPWIRLVAPNGTTVAQASAATVAQVNVVLTQTGNYQVLAASNDAAHVGTGNYKIILEKGGAFNTPAGDQGGHLNTNGTTTAGSITIGDIDRFTFNAVAGAPLVVTITNAGGGTTDFQPWIRLVSPTAAILGTQSGLSGATISVTAPSTGLYTVAVATQDNGRDATGNYALSVTGAFTYGFSATWGAITPTGPTGRQVTLTLAMNMGPAPGRSDINGNLQDELIGTQYTLQYNGSLLTYDSRLGLDPNLDLVAVASPFAGVTNVAQSSQSGLTSHGNVQLVRITYNIPTGVSGTVTPTVSFTEVLAGLVNTPIDVTGDVIATLPPLVIP